MGVCHAIICTKCNEFIDLDKSRELFYLKDEHIFFDSENKYTEYNSYHAHRAFWFMWRHRDRECDAIWSTDHDGNHFEKIGHCAEVAKIP